MTSTDLQTITASWHWPQSAADAWSSLEGPQEAQLQELRLAEGLVAAALLGVNMPHRDQQRHLPSYLQAPVPSSSHKCLK